MEIFKLVGSIFVDSDEANKSLSKTDEKASGVGQKLLGGVKSAGKFAAGMVAASATAVTAITAFANKTASTCDEIDKMSQKLGMSYEEYQEWDYVLSQAGVEITSMSTGLKTLTNKIDDAKNGSAKATAMFEKLGISTKNLNKMSRSQVFDAVINGMQGMEDSTERAALANDLFGKSGQELSALFNESAESTENLKKQAHDLGMVLDNETIKAGVDLTDTIDTLKRSLSAVFANLSGSVMPIVEKVANFIIEHMPQIEAMFAKLEPVINAVFDQLVPPLLELGEALFPVILDLITQLMPLIVQIMDDIMPIIIELIELLLPPIIQIVEKLLPPIIRLLEPILKLLDPLIKLLEPILDLVVAILDPVAKLLDELLTPLITIITEVITAALEPFQSIISKVGKLIGNYFNVVVESTLSRFEAMKTVFSDLIQFLKDVFQGDWQAVWEDVKKIFDDIWEGIKEAFKIPINFIIDGLNTFIDGLNKIKIPDWVPAVGGKGIDIPNIPNLATGGVLEKGQTGFLEGNGAEAVVPLENNRKWIHAVAQDMQNTGLGGGKTDELLAAILDALEDIAGMGIYLDKDHLVGELLKPIDKGLGKIAAQKARG